MQRLSRWQIFGLCASILWIVGTLYFTYNETADTAQSLSNFAFDTCTHLQDGKQSTNTASCVQQKQEKYELFMKGAWTNASIAAFFPIPFFWMFGVIFLTVYRCFAIGYKEVLNLQKFSKIKRYFVYFSYLFTAITILFFAIYSMDKHVDGKVLTNLGFHKSVNSYDGYVEVEGTWVSGNSLDHSSKIYSPQQTSKIVCHQEKMSCIESRALIKFGGSNPSLAAELMEYEVKKWTKDSIVFIEESACSTIVLTIDLNSKSLNSIEKFSANVPNKSFCDQYKNNKESVFRLENGYTVYNDLRREASPYPLKIINALFGN
jgi:hypothetical protein